MLPGIRAELDALRRRHSAALELMGERDEEVQTEFFYTIHYFSLPQLCFLMILVLGLKGNLSLLLYYSSKSNIFIWEIIISGSGNVGIF